MSQKKLPWIAWLFLVVLIALIGGAMWLAGVPNESSQGGPSLTLRDESAADESPFVSDRVCADCHSEQFAGHRQTGHADTFALSAESTKVRWLDGQKFEDPERGYVYEYHLDDQGLSVSIPQHFGSDRFPLTYVLGSGQHALTFLTLVPDRFGDTTGVEHRVSLYASEDVWELDLTPGHRAQAPQQDTELFGKVMQGDLLDRCVDCHTTTGKIVQQQIENLTPHVGCQNCHGAGREHVAAMKEGRQGSFQGFTQQSAMEEIEMCGSCHRLPDTDSGTAESPNDIRIVRFQSVGLLQSQCFQRSPDDLRCSTCHDLHQPVAREPSHYVTRCLNCHDQPATANCPVSPRTDCVKCHMPAVDIHRGIEFHDHWIRVRSDGPTSDATSTEGNGE